MKTVTIKQPYASLICEGIKKIENRTWPTKYRGRVLVHSSAKSVPIINPNNVFTARQWESLTTDQQCHVIGGYMPNSAIIGSVEIVDCGYIEESIWSEIGVWNWVLANPILFPEPILNVKGKLSFWDYQNILAEPEEKDGELFCHCQLPVKEQSQVMNLAGEYRCRYCDGKWYK